MTTVLVVDDQELVRAGFRLILESNGIDVVGEAADGEAAVAAALGLRPDVVLMDVRMPVMDGIAATRQLLADGAGCGTTRVLMLTTFDLDEHVYEAVQAGASGFLLKDVAPGDLVHAVRVVARGDAMLAPALTRRLLERFAGQPQLSRRPEVLGGLSEREIDVVKGVARGLSNSEMAAEMFLSETTVKTYLSRLLAKLDLRDRVQVAVLAYESGLVQPGTGSGAR